jgi:putative Mg2+ transporter-C (MgtC) family protein
MPYQLGVLAKMVAAVIFGGVVGWQREARDRPAGLRTHVLVCVGSTVYTLASLHFSGPGSDPGRVAANVATGMGFLGAGTIIRHGNMVRGLTTAASLWAVAAIGICVGIGGVLYWVAGIATLVVLLTLSLLSEAERRWLPRSREAQLRIRLRGAPERILEIQRMLAARDVRLRTMELSTGQAGQVQQIEIAVRLPPGLDVGRLTSELAQLEGLVSMHCE